MPLSPVLDLLVPHRCVTCAARSEPPWCASCARAAGTLAIDLDTACDRCAGPSDRHACWRGVPPVDSLVATYRYHGPVADAIVAGKTRGVRAVWRRLGRRLATRVAPEAIDVVTWVAAPARRRRARGFDHAELLARALAGRVHRPIAGLLRAHPALPDRGRADAPDRARLAAGAYRAHSRIRPARILLVDDVLTTGATMRAAGDALRRAGASEVHGAVVARAGEHPLGADDRPS